MLFYILVALALAYIVSGWVNFFYARRWTVAVNMAFGSLFVAYVPYLFYSLIHDLGSEFNLIANVLNQHQDMINQIVSRITRF